MIKGFSFNSSKDPHDAMMSIFKDEKNCSLLVNKLNELSDLDEDRFYRLSEFVGTLTKDELVKEYTNRVLKNVLTILIINTGYMKALVEMFKVKKNETKKLLIGFLDDKKLSNVQIDLDAYMNLSLQSIKQNYNRELNDSMMGIFISKPEKYSNLVNLVKKLEDIYPNMDKHPELSNFVDQFTDNDDIKEYTNRVLKKVLEILLKYPNYKEALFNMFQVEQNQTQGLFHDFLDEFKKYDEREWINNLNLLEVIKEKWDTYQSEQNTEKVRTGGIRRTSKNRNKSRTTKKPKRKLLSHKRKKSSSSRKGKKSSIRQ